MKRIVEGGSIVFLLLLGQGVGADESMRCGQRLVSCGEPIGEVSRKCGPPSSTERHYEYNQDGTGSTVDTWVYNRGAQELVRILTFVNGRLRHIEVGGYGG